MTNPLSAPSSSSPPPDPPVSASIAPPPSSPPAASAELAPYPSSSSHQSLPTPPQPFFTSPNPMYPHPPQTQHHTPPPYPPYQSPPPFPYPAPTPQYFQQQPMYQVPHAWHTHPPPPHPSVHSHPSSPPFPSPGAFYAWPPQPPHPTPHPPANPDHSPSPRHRRRHAPDATRPSVRNRHTSPRANRRPLNDPSTPKSARFLHPEQPQFFDHDDSDAIQNDASRTTLSNSSRRANRRRAVTNNSTQALSNSINANSTLNNPPSNSLPSANPSSQTPATHQTSMPQSQKPASNRTHSSENPDKDTQAASLELDRAAKNAVDSANEVTLALLLTSWANSLAEAQQLGGGAAGHFENVFHGSQALEIVFGNVLLMDILPTSAVKKALISLLRFVLYGDQEVHSTFADHIIALNIPLNKEENETIRPLWTQARSTAIKTFLEFLRNISINIRAYIDVLPSISQRSENVKPRSPIGGAPQNSSGPAGPDPTKAVERSMSSWRRAVARLQGEMAIIVVLKKALTSIDNDLRFSCDVDFQELQNFVASMRSIVRSYLKKDIMERTSALNSRYWSDVTDGAEGTVFEAARSRANMWLNQFEASRQEVESQLDDAGIGFGPSARVSEDKFSVLVSASAGVAALVSCHQHSFSWAKDTAKLLCSMITAFHTLENMCDASLGPSVYLKETFFKGLEDAFRAIDDVVNWSFASLHDKVLGSLEKSTVDPLQISDVPPQRSRSLRFEEPPKTPSKTADNGDGGGSQPQSRRKPRHARMKSSPDALLHLNAHFDDYSDAENDVDREIDREIDQSEMREAELVDFEEIGTPKMLLTPKHRSTRETNGETEGGSRKRGDDELPVVYEGLPLEFGDDDDDDDDRDIVVHEDLEDAAKPKKMSHTSHVRSMSVDGIPF